MRHQPAREFFISSCHLERESAAGLTKVIRVIEKMTDTLSHMAIRKALWR
jgi:hypothetical protein